MMARKREARLRVVARGALQRVDEAGERRERRAQFVARIGDEIRAHLLDPVQRREIVKHQQDRGGRRRVAERADMRHEPAVDRHALGELDALRAAAGRDRAHRLDHLGGAQRERGGRAARERWRDDARQGS